MKKKSKGSHKKYSTKADRYRKNENKIKYKPSSIYKGTKKREKKWVNILVCGISIMTLVVIVVLVKVGMDREKKMKVFKGKEYFEYLGISKASPFKETLYETYDLQEVDNIAVGKYYYEGETYYRFQAKKNGRLAYDNEITDYQGEIKEVSEKQKVKVETGKDGQRVVKIEEPNLQEIKSRVEVYKRTYTKPNGSNVSIFYYKLIVPPNKVKML